MSLTIQRSTGSIVITADPRGYYTATRDGSDLPLGMCRPAPLAEAGVTLPPRHQGKGYTHILGNICLTSGEAAELLRQAAEREAAYAATPAGLREQRDRLAREIGYALDEWHELHQQAIEQISARGHTMLRDQVDAAAARADAARAALDEFDAAHPDIRAAVEAERAESVQRHMWD